MVRRATAALLGTIAGTALLVGAKYAAPPPVGAGNAIGDTGTGDPGTDPLESGSVDPSGAGSADPGASQPADASAPAAGPTSTKATPPAGTRTPTPTKTTAAPACKTAAGAGSTVASPGVGSVVVTVKVCSGALSSASATISKSNWEPQNTNAFVQLNSLAVKYYKTDMSKITVSGATKTSNAYQASLKSALGKAGI